MHVYIDTNRLIHIDIKYIHVCFSIRELKFFLHLIYKNYSNKNRIIVIENIHQVLTGSFVGLSLKFHNKESIIVIHLSRIRKRRLRDIK